MSRNREIELKLELEPGSAEALLALPLLGAPAKIADQLSVYFDTPDGGLREAGFSLRVRKSGASFLQTVKQAGIGSAGLFDRGEWEEETRELEPELALVEKTPLGDILSKKIRKRLRPLIRGEVRRSIWELERGGSRIELLLDEGTISGGGKSQQIAEIEVELLEGDEAPLFDLAREIGRAVPVRIGVLTKAERGYALAEGMLGKAMKSERIELNPNMLAADGFTAIAYACLRHFRLNEALVISRREPSALHQARVAMRRLRSAFTLFRPVIAGVGYEELREEVRWFTSQLGDARNLDVLLKRFGGAEKKHKAGEALRLKLLDERERAYDLVLEALNSQRLRDLMLELVAWVELGAWREDNGMAVLPLPDYASAQLDKRWKKVKKGGRALDAHDPEPRHQLRIEVKKLRYAVEFLASLHRDGDRAPRQKALADALEDLQEHLGELNDTETARILLGNLLEDAPEGEAMMRFAARQVEQPGSQDEQIAAAKVAHARLAEIGRYWRATAQ